MLLKFKKLSTKNFIAIIFALLLTVSSTDLFSVSQGGAHILYVTPGARACGMGESFVAIADDISTIWWNPAGLALVNSKAFHLQHSQLVPSLANDIYYEVINYGMPLEGIGNIGLSLYYLTYGEQESRDPNGNFKERFSSYELVSALTYATKINENISVGGSVKLIWSDLAPAKVLQDNTGKDGSGYAVATDIGFLYRERFDFLSFFDDEESKNFDTFRFGVNLANLGTEITYIDDNQSDPLPRNLKLGATILPINRKEIGFLATAELEKSLILNENNKLFSKDETIFKYGVELNYANMIFGRLGYVYDDPGSIKGFSYGLGFGLPKYGFNFDFALIPQAEGLDPVQRYSLQVDIDKFLHLIKSN